MYDNFETDLENKILYCMFTYPDEQSKIFKRLEKQFFQDTLNSKIYDVSKKLYLEGQTIEALTIFDYFNDKNISFRLTEIMELFENSCHITRYCKMLFKRYFEKLVKEAKTEEDFNELQQLKNHYFYEESKIAHITDGIKDLKKRLEERKHTKIYTGYKKLDTILGSFMGGDYITIGGATGTGKTSIALNIARQACLQGKTVLYFSLEMTLEQLQNRFVAMCENLQSSKFRSSDFSLNDVMQYEQALEKIKKYDLKVVTEYNLTADRIEAKIKEQQQDKLDLVIIDYLTLIKGYDNKSLYEKTTLLSRNIKLMATNFNIPIVVLVQLNREIRNRENKRPILSDIRESGAIEQDSDFVLFAYRPEAANEIETDRIERRFQNNLEIIVAKNRHGANRKIIKFDFDLNTQLITEGLNQ